MSGWAVPASPAPLVQEREGVAGDPWRMLVVCVLCNMTPGERAYPVALSLFERWPTAGEMSAADPSDLEPYLRPLGLWRRRADTVVRLSAAYADGGWRDPSDLPGVGRYARDAWAIFVEGRDDLWPDDGHLVRYVRWRASEGSWAVPAPVG